MLVSYTLANGTEIKIKQKSMIDITVGTSSKKTQPAQGLNAADICTNCVYTIPSPRDGSPIPFLGKPDVASCRMAGSVPHKSGGCRV